MTNPGAEVRSGSGGGERPLEANVPDRGDGRGDGAAGAGGLRGLLRPLLGVPLFYKILAGNVLVVVVGAVVAPWATDWYHHRSPDSPTASLVLLFVVVGVGVSALVNAVIIRVALRPLNQLEQSARRVQQGDMNARAPISPLADRELARLINAFNGMLDGITGYRRRLREVAARALTAAEEERRRIALELHDETSQVLAALMLRLRVLRTIEDAHRRDAVIEELRRELAEAAEGTRRYARGLRPPALDELGLAAAIESHARALGDMTGLDIEVEADSVPRDLLSPEGELALYRICQEGLSNVARHAEADQAWVRLTRDPGAVVVTIEDDGRGFDVDAVLAEDDRGLGLFGMLERADYLGGRVDIESEPGAGSLIRAVVPIRTADRGQPTHAVD